MQLSFSIIFWRKLAGFISEPICLKTYGLSKKDDDDEISNRSQQKAE